MRSSCQLGVFLVFLSFTSYAQVWAQPAGPVTAVEIQSIIVDRTMARATVLIQGGGGAHRCTATYDGRSIPGPAIKDRISNGMGATVTGAREIWTFQASTTPSLLFGIECVGPNDNQKRSASQQVPAAMPPPPQPTSAQQQCEELARRQREAPPTPPVSPNDVVEKTSFRWTGTQCIGTLQQSFIDTENYQKSPFYRHAAWLSCDTADALSCGLVELGMLYCWCDPTCNQRGDCCFDAATFQQGNGNRDCDAPAAPEPRHCGNHGDCDASERCDFIAGICFPQVTLNACVLATRCSAACGEACKPECVGNNVDDDGDGLIDEKTEGGLGYYAASDPFLRNPMCPAFDQQIVDVITWDVRQSFFDQLLLCFPRPVIETSAFEDAYLPDYLQGDRDVTMPECGSPFASTIHRLFDSRDRRFAFDDPNLHSYERWGLDAYIDPAQGEPYALILLVTTDTGETIERSFPVTTGWMRYELDPNDIDLGGRRIRSLDLIVDHGTVFLGQLHRSAMPLQ